MAGVEIPQRTRPGVIVITRPMPRVLQRIISAPGIRMHQRDDGRVVLGEQDGAPQNEAHALRLDGHPVIGSSPDRPDVYIAIMHSGVTLAPIVGQRAAQELLDGAILDSLEPYRPDRSFEMIKRY